MVIQQMYRCLIQMLDPPETRTYYPLFLRTTVECYVSFYANLGLMLFESSFTFFLLGHFVKLLLPQHQFTGTFHDTVPNYKKTKQQQPQTSKPQDLFWTPTKSISASNLYFEGGIYQSLDVWARVRLMEAQQVNSNVTRAESSYHSRVAADTLLRVTRPCLIEHGIHVSSVNRIIKGLLRGTFGLPMGKVHPIGSKANKFIATTAAPSKQTISNMLTSPSWIQGAIPLLELQAYEEQFLPQMEGWREVQAKNRVMEINALNRACKSWQDTIR